MKRLLIVLMLGLVAACDSGTEPIRVTSLSIFQGAAQADEQTLQVGATIELRATPRDAAGNPLIRPVTWRSTAPTIASVDTAGRVTGNAPGTALIIATVETLADTVRVNVFVPAPKSEIECAPNAVPLQLQVGQVQTFSADQARNLCIGGISAETSEYTVIPFNSRATGNLTLEIAGGGIAPVTGPPNPALSPSFSLGGSAGMGPQKDHTFHDRLRQWERENFGRARSAPASGPSRSLSLQQARAVPEVGDILTLNVSTKSACSDPVFRGARVEAISDRAIMVADTLNPEGGFTAAEYQQFGSVFDRVVWRVLTEQMGEPSDLDNNQRVIIFFTRAVNELTEPGSESFVGGFYWGRDLLNKTGTDGCEGSNQAEMFYQLVPDTAGVAGNKRTKEFVAQRTMGVIAHEFQHLVNRSRRVFINNAPVDEVVWMNEGLSHIAEELVFYDVAGLLPHLNLDRPALREPAVFPVFVEYGSSNFGRLNQFLKEPERYSPIGPDNLATRGAIWSFLRYAGDRKADARSQRPIWYELVNSKTRGVENLTNVLAVQPLDWMHDWAVSVYTDDAGLSVPPQFTQPSWNARSVLTMFTSNNNRYPLKTIQMVDGLANQTKLTLQPAGAAYLRVGVRPGERAALRTTASEAAPPSWLRLTVVRTR